LVDSGSHPLIVDLLLPWLILTGQKGAKLHKKFLSTPDQAYHKKEFGQNNQKNEAAHDF